MLTHAYHNIRHRVEVKLPKPVTTPITPWRQSPPSCRSRNDQGLVGLGEARTSATDGLTAQVIEHELRNYLIGQDPRDIEYLWK